MASTINATSTSNGGLISTGDDSGVLNIQTNETTAVTIDASQNVGIGTSPSAWVSRFKILQSGNQAAFAADNTYNATSLGTNWYEGSGGDTYIGTGRALRYQLQGNTGNHAWFNAASGTAGNAISFTQAMTLDSSGNLQFNSGYGSVATAYGCRAWVNFNGTGTVAIRASGNVSSITDGGVGIYTVNFSTAMPDVNYSVAMSGEGGGGSGNKGPYLSTFATGSLVVFVYNGSGSLVDANPVCVNIFR